MVVNMLSHFGLESQISNLKGLSGTVGDLGRQFLKIFGANGRCCTVKLLRGHLEAYSHPKY